MHCPRCNGLMSLTRFYDLRDDTGTFSFVAWRCISCGEVLDSVIYRNRIQPPMITRLWKLRPAKT